MCVLSLCWWLWVLPLSPCEAIYTSHQSHSQALSIGWLLLVVNLCVHKDRCSDRLYAHICIYVYIFIIATHS